MVDWIQWNFEQYARGEENDGRYDRPPAGYEMTGIDIVQRFFDEDEQGKCGEKRENEQTTQGAGEHQQGTFITSKKLAASHRSLEYLRATYDDKEGRNHAPRSKS